MSLFLHAAKLVNGFVERIEDPKLDVGHIYEGDVRTWLKERGLTSNEFQKTNGEFIPLAQMENWLSMPLKLQGTRTEESEPQLTWAFIQAAQFCTKHGADMIIFA